MADEDDKESRPTSREVFKVGGGPMERDKLIRLLAGIASMIPTLESDRANYYAFVSQHAIFDYSCRDGLKARFFEAMSNRDYDGACEIMGEAFDAIFDVEIEDLYADVARAVCERPDEFVN